MCWTTSQILVVTGLVFEFLSVFVTVKKVFWDMKKYVEKQILHKTMGKYQVTEEIRARDGEIAIVLLIIGMILQGLGVFV